MTNTQLSSDEVRPAGNAVVLPRRAVLRGAITALGVLSLGGTTLLRSRPAFAAPQVGQPAPAFSGVDTNGVARDLAALKGKIVVLEWTNADCPFVKKHYESSNMQKLQKEATAAGAIWLSIISSAPGEQGHVDAAKANELTKSRDAAPSGILLDPDGTIGRTYTAQTTPHMYIIDPEGVLRYMGGIDSLATPQIGDIEKAQPYFHDAFLAVSKGEPVKNAVTRPYGCSVKYAA
jgi:peroxiredoxin